MAEPAIELELDHLSVYPVLHPGDIDAFLRLNRRYFVLLDHPDGVTDEARWNVLNQIALNFRSLDHWLSQGEALPKAWEGRRVEHGEQTPASSGTEGSPEGCGEKGT